MADLRYEVFLLPHSPLVVHHEHLLLLARWVDVWWLHPVLPKFVDIGQKEGRWLLRIVRLGCVTSLGFSDCDEWLRGLQVTLAFLNCLTESQVEETLGLVHMRVNLLVYVFEWQRSYCVLVESIYRLVEMHILSSRTRRCRWVPLRQDIVLCLNLNIGHLLQLVYLVEAFSLTRRWSLDCCELASGACLTPILCTLSSY